MGTAPGGDQLLLATAIGSTLGNGGHGHLESETGEAFCGRPQTYDAEEWQRQGSFPIASSNDGEGHLVFGGVLWPPLSYDIDVVIINCRHHGSGLFTERLVSKKPLRAVRALCEQMAERRRAPAELYVNEAPLASQEVEDFH